MVTIATITHKNQLTLPKEFIKDSELEGTRKVLLEKKGDKILIKPLKSKVHELAGSLHNPKRKPLKRYQERKLTQDSIAHEALNEGL